MTTARQWTRAQALRIGIDDAELRASSLLVGLLLLVLLRYIAGS